MALRLYRLTDEDWKRLAASRRAEQVNGPPPRTSISAIEVELRLLVPGHDPAR